MINATQNNESNVASRLSPDPMAERAVWRRVMSSCYISDFRSDSLRMFPYLMSREDMIEEEVGWDMEVDDNVLDDKSSFCSLSTAHADLSHGRGPAKRIFDVVLALGRFICRRVRSRDQKESESAPSGSKGAP